MKKRKIISMAAMCLILSFSACQAEAAINECIIGADEPAAKSGSAEEKTESGGFAPVAEEERNGDLAQAEISEVTFSDDLGRSVTVENPQRVAPLLGSFAQIWMLSGGEVCATADDAWDNLELDLPEDAVNLGNTKELSLELLFSAQPDFIIASTNTRQHMEWKETLEATGIPTAYFDVSDFDDYLRVLSICTDITGQKDLYEENGAAVQEQIDAVVEKSRLRLKQGEAPVVLAMVMSATSVYAKNSEGNVLGEMLDTLGCVNIADANEKLLENLSIEYILQQDPDYIFVVQHGDDTEGTKEHMRQLFEENVSWASLSAVKNNKVYFMDKQLYNLKPNNRWGEAYEGLEAILGEGQTEGQG